MGIDYKDFTHVVTLLAIVESPDFTALNKGSAEYGHHVVNHDRHLFVKYCDNGEAARTSSPTRSPIRSSFSKQRVGEVLRCAGLRHSGHSGVTADELEKLVDLHSPLAYGVRVEVEPRKWPRLSSRWAESPPIARSTY